MSRLRLRSGSRDALSGQSWTVEAVASSYGVLVGLRSNEGEGLELLLERLPPGWRASSARTVDRIYSLVVNDEVARPIWGHYLLYEDGKERSRGELAPVLHTFEWFAGLAIAERARQGMFVHAGVVGWKGRAILLPGTSEVGKTTLTAELARAGAIYLSDEYAVIDERGRVHPFPKPLSVREGGGGRSERSVHFFGGTQGTTPLPVGLVVLTRYREGATFRPRRLSPGRAVLELMANTVAARTEPERALATLQEVSCQAPVLKGVRGEAAETVPVILARAEGSRP